MFYTSGSKVGTGFYLNTQTFDQVTVREGKQVLPGNNTKYLRLPILFLIVVGPLLGLGLVMFLPMIGIFLTAQVGVEILVKKAKKLGEYMSYIATPPEAIQVTALTKAEEPEETEADAVLCDLAQEVKAQREAGAK